MMKLQAVAQIVDNTVERRPGSIDEALYQIGSNKVRSFCILAA
jgi:hypothetical protein